MAHKNYIAIDYGTKKSGLAYSVEGFCFAGKTVPTHQLISELERYIQEKKSDAIIIGMPYHIDGGISQHGKRVQQWIHTHKDTFAIPVITHDERLTTSEARIAFHETGYNGDIDAESARIILEDYLESSQVKDSI